MAAQSFGSEFTHLDSARAPDELLSYLDRVAALPAIQRIKAVATQRLALEPGNRVLDVGCGTGVDLAQMLSATRPDGSVVGIDVSRRAIEVAAQRTSNSSGIVTQVADVHELPFADASFDAIRADRVMLHLDDPERALSEIRRVLASAGRIVILEMGNELKGSSHLLEGRAYQRLREVMWRPEEVRAQMTLFLPLLFARAGFGAARVEQGAEMSRGFAAADDLLRLAEGMRDAVTAGAVTQAEADRWLEDVSIALNRGLIEIWTRFTLYCGTGAR